MPKRRSKGAPYKTARHNAKKPVTKRTRRPRIPPHEKLPPELMQIIIELCTAADNIFRIPVVHQHAINVIPHVCSAWRTLAFNMPKLWSRVCLQISRDDVNRLRVQAARTILSRATLCNGSDGERSYPPLSLKITTAPNSHVPISTDMEPFYDLIASYPFQTLNLTFHKRDHFRPLLGLLNETWPNVDELELGFCHLLLKQRSPPLSPGMNMRPLEVLDVVWDGLNCGAVVLWHQLRHLVFSSWMPAPTTFCVLRQAMSLKSFDVRIAPSTRTTRWRHTIAVPSLDSLKLTFMNSADAEPFISCLSLPNTSTLEVHKALEAGPLLKCDAISFAELARRSGGMKLLQTLVVQQSEFELDVDLLLRSMPALAHLEHGSRRWDFVRQ
ncbi:hypothetical protein AX17_003264 [Amanita inopinata Kibby_2008]|nr:hypothetical protein AX17_003264 [Amanita inopinata Kibby_2008]